MLKNIKLTLLLTLGGISPLAAKENWCSANAWHSNRMISHAEVREERLAAAPETLVEPGQNGSIRLHGWSGTDIQVKACVQASAPDASSAEALAKSVTISEGSGRIVAKGPAAGNDSWWSVSYEIWAPASMSMQLEAFNGSIHVEGMAGHIRAHTLNGSLKFKEVSGDVDGETTNGSLAVELASGGWHGSSGLKLTTVNGSIQLQLAAASAAEVEASTMHGRVQSDFPNEGDPSDKTSVRFTVGAGGAKIAAHTINGSVHIVRQM